MQKLGWRLCHLKPAEIARMTIGELDIVLEEGYQEYEEKVRLYVDLKVSILNAPHFQKKNGNAYMINEFLPKQFQQKEAEITAEEQARRISEKGRKLAAKCDQYKRR